MEKLTKEQEILKILFKEFKESYNSRSISKKIGMSHVGAFKILKKLEGRKIVLGKRIGKAVIYTLNLNNPMTFREIEMLLTLEAQKYGRWLEEFSGLKEETDFVILFGSVIRNEKEAKDIDILIVSKRNNILRTKKLIEEKNEIASKKLHALFQTKEDFFKDLKNKNKVMLEIIKTGIVLFGQENLTKYLKEFLE